MKWTPPANTPVTKVNTALAPAPAPAPTQTQSAPTQNRGTDYGLGTTEEGNFIQPKSEAELAAERYRNEIGAAWDGYISSLDQQGQFIDQQTGAQRGIADNTYNQNVSEIESGRTRSLRDLQSTARNALAAGNNYLGALGAGDSSASGMYKYAIDRDQLKQVGDLDNFVMGQKSKLKTEYDNQILGIQNWFAQQQQALQQAKSQGLLQKGLDIASLSKDLLNNALQAVATAKADAVNRSNLLLEWAVNNSANQAGVQSTLNNIASGLNTDISTTGISNGGIQFGGNVAPSNNEDPNKLQ
jgi:phage shock protein A